MDVCADGKCSDSKVGKEPGDAIAPRAAKQNISPGGFSLPLAPLRLALADSLLPPNSTKNLSLSGGFRQIPAYFGGLGVYGWKGNLNIEVGENGSNSHGAGWLVGPIDATTGR